MKKISLIFMAVMIAALAGCAGDTEGTTNTLATVASFELDASSTGRTINLVWSEVTDVDGYKIYFKENGTGDWAEIGTSTTTAYTDNATVAGTYSVKAYKGEDLSENFATAASTMPNIINTTFTIYDRWSAADSHSAFQFNPNDGLTGLASDTGFEKDMYAWDEDKGDGAVWLYSANFGYYASSRQSYFQTPASGVYGNCDPSGSWVGTAYKISASDSVVFVKLPYSGGTNAFVKMYNLSVTPDPDTPRGTIVSFSYEYQPNDLGLTVFTSRAN